MKKKLDDTTDQEDKLWKSLSGKKPELDLSKRTEKSGY